MGGGTTTEDLKIEFLIKKKEEFKVVTFWLLNITIKKKLKVQENLHQKES